MAKIGKALEKRRFDPKIRDELKSIRKRDKKTPSTAINRRQLENDETYASGGPIPPRFRKLAKKKKTSIPFKADQ